MSWAYILDAIRSRLEDIEGFGTLIHIKVVSAMTVRSAPGPPALSCSRKYESLTWIIPVAVTVDL